MDESILIIQPGIVILEKNFFDRFLSLYFFMILEFYFNLCELIGGSLAGTRRRRPIRSIVLVGTRWRRPFRGISQNLYQMMIFRFFLLMFEKNKACFYCKRLAERRSQYLS